MKKDVIDILNKYTDPELNSFLKGLEEDMSDESLILRDHILKVKKDRVELLKEIVK